MAAPEERVMSVAWTPSTPLPSPLRSHHFTIKPGDTLVDLLQGIGVEPATAEAARKALNARYRPKRLQVGQSLLVTVLRTEPHAGGAELLALSLGISTDRVVNLRRSGEVYTVSVDPRPQDLDPKTARPEAAGNELEPADGLYLTRALRLGPKDTLLDALRAAKVDPAETGLVLRAAGGVTDVRALQAGQHIKIILHAPAEDGRGGRIAALAAPLAHARTLLLAPAVGGGFTAWIQPAPAGALPAPPAARPRFDVPGQDPSLLVASVGRQYDPQKFGFATSALALRAVPNLNTPEEPKARTVRPGETLLSLLTTAGVEATAAHEAIGAIRKLFNPRELQVGQAVQIALLDAPAGEGGRQIERLALAVRPDRDLILDREPDGDYRVSWFDRPVLRTLARREGRIQSSLYEAAAVAGLPDTKAAELINLFSWDVDFQREVQKGDRFEVLYEEANTMDGVALAPGPIRFAALTLSGQRLAIYRYLPADDGQADYFTASGRSIRKALLRTPLDAVKITSSYGVRMHPILGYDRMHRGVDFGAPTGTPIKAAGDGVVEFSGWFSGHGNYVRIRHTGRYATAYGHLARFGADIRTGARVRQGQIIGLVGMTGTATGPHLHYEVLVGGQQINPTSVKMPTGRELDGAELRRFKAAIAKLDAEFDGLGRATQMVRARQ